jgi:hypothetical protein
MSAVPQVVLFGSIEGEWRERHIIPVLIAVPPRFALPFADGWELARA